MTTSTAPEHSTFYNGFYGLPMPGDQFLNKGTVVASCYEVTDTSEDNSAHLLILRPDAPYYLVCYVTRENYDSPWQYLGGDQFRNIIPASESYSDLIGGY